MHAAFIAAAPCTTRPSSFTAAPLRPQSAAHAYAPAFARRCPAVCASSEDGQATGVRISRRQAIQILNGGLGALSFILLYKMRAQFRMLSPNVVLTGVGLGPLSVRAAGTASVDGDERFREATEFIDKMERRGPVQCVDFPNGSDWINSRPLSLEKELKGKLVLLDFFTYCCVNCQHVLPRLAELEKKYGQDGSGGVVVVGVHSAKFTAERETQNIAAAVERYDVRHPVINDERLVLWNAIGVSSWPTLVLVGPRGNLLSMWSGERQEGDIDNVLSAALEYYKNDIDHRPLPLAPPRSALLRRPADSPLRYPGKIALSQDGTSLFVADSGNNRIVQVEPASGKLIRVFGSGQEGLVDSKDPSKAAFHHPQGLAEAEGILYVADTESHAVRAINLASGAVSTLGGTGEQGFDYVAGQIGKLQRLSSPWDVEVAGGKLYVAIAGTHQIWSLDLTTPPTSTPWRVFSGTGREQELNSSDAKSAAWAQPSHLSAGLNGQLYVADSESSSIRAVGIGNDDRHPTRTLAGGDGLLADNLFAFGDKDGRGARARFQHPLGVVHDPTRGLVYVTDSYNHRIKTVDDNGVAKTLCGSGSPGFKDGKAASASFWEPGGLALSRDGSTLYVSDTNNCAVRVVDITSKAVRTLQLSTVPEAGASTGGDARLVPNRRRAVQIPVDGIVEGSTIAFTISLPPKSHFTPGTTSKFQVNLLPTGKADGSTILTKGVVEASDASRKGTFNVRLAPVVAGAQVEVEAVSYYCGDADDVCRTEADIFTFSVQPSASSGSDESSIVEHTVASRRPSGGPVAAKF